MLTFYDYDSVEYEANEKNTFYQTKGEPATRPTRIQPQPLPAPPPLFKSLKDHWLMWASQKKMRSTDLPQ